MAPIRRYLRITKFSVLEVRIYLHKPSDASWLLSSRDNVLARIIQEVRPKVLPKLREENENSKQKTKGSKKKRGIKDVASQDDFEVSIFLKETASRHSLLTKRKEFSQKPKLRSNGKGLTGWLGAGNGGERKEDAIDLEEANEVPQILREEEQDEVVDLSAIPEVGEKKRSGRKRKSAEVDGGEGEGQDEDEALFVSSSDEEFFATQRAQPAKKRRKRAEDEEEVEQGGEDDEELDDKKKMTLDTNYDGFSIYGRILCLIVTRKGKKEPQARALDDAAPAGGSQMMERFIATQVAREEGLSDVEEG